MTGVNDTRFPSVRGAVYGYLAAAFLRAANRGILRDFHDTALRNSVFFSDYGEHIDAVAAALACDPDRWDSLERDYSALFEYTGPSPIPLWKSAYVADSGVLLDGATLAVKREYKKWGLGVRRKERQIPDHVGVMCDFLGFLNATSMDATDERAIQNSLAAQKAFLTEHLGCFYERFCDRLEQSAASAYYKSLARFFRGFVGGEIASPGILETPFPGEAAPETPTPPKSFDGLVLCRPAPEELADEPCSIVPTAGCNNCGGNCVIHAHVQEGCVLRLSTVPRPDDAGEDVLTACVRGSGYRRSFLTAARLRYPMKRVGERGKGVFERITWEEATDVIASRTREIGEKYGPASRYVNIASGVRGIVNGRAIVQRLLALDGGYLGLYNSYSSACAGIVTPYIYGTSTSGSTSDTFADSKLILLWGHNPVESGFGNSTHLDIMRAKDKGVKIIVIDPRFSDTAAAYADEWIGIRPTTDGALADAMAYVIVSENLQDQAFLDAHCIGFDASHMPEDLRDVENYAEHLRGVRDHIPKTPQWAQEITGIPADT
ncbi:MAG: molybdopterin-dependent oxidoreductase, partial [Synergistaceae bacterium]|nr:molybdopterin-dependent oxidoreductase [Synergistaceae bacterium]